MAVPFPEKIAWKEPGRKLQVTWAYKPLLRFTLLGEKMAVWKVRTSGGMEATSHALRVAKPPFPNPESF